MKNPYNHPLKVANLNHIMINSDSIAQHEDQKTYTMQNT